MTILYKILQKNKEIFALDDAFYWFYEFQALTNKSSIFYVLNQRKFEKCPIQNQYSIHCPNNLNWFTT